MQWLQDPKRNGATPGTENSQLLIPGIWVFHRFSSLNLPSVLVSRYAAGKALGLPMSLQLLGLSVIGTALGGLACEACRTLLSTEQHTAAFASIPVQISLCRLFWVPGTLAALDLDVTRGSAAQNAR